LALSFCCGYCIVAGYMINDEVIWQTFPFSSVHLYTPHIPIILNEDGYGYDI